MGQPALYTIHDMTSSRDHLLRLLGRDRLRALADSRYALMREAIPRSLHLLESRPEPLLLLQRMPCKDRQHHIELLLYRRIFEKVTTIGQPTPQGRGHRASGG